MQVDSHEPLVLATDHYYWKPMTGFFRAFELRAYRHAQVSLNPPILDLGCSDGLFARMISKLLRIDVPFVGMDMDPAALQEANRLRADRYRLVARADAGRVPFAASAFQTVIANGVVPCIPGDLSRVFREVARVLRPNGRFIFTAPTVNYGRHYWLYRMLHGIGLSRLGDLYRARLDRRMDHIQFHSAAGWADLAEGAGLRPERVVGFCPPEVIVRWSLLAVTPLRLHGLLRLLPLPALCRLFTRVHRRMFRRAYDTIPLECDPDESGYVLIQARKCD